MPRRLAGVEIKRRIAMTIALNPRGMLMLAAALCIALLGLPGAALATPTITLFKIAALPIPGVPGTGDILGAGAMIQGEVTIAGTEYGGAPPPVTELKFYAPVGAQLHPQGFATCAPSVLENSGPRLCPQRSIAGPKGSATGVVTLGGERVGETASVQPFFAPGGGLDAFVDGSTPVSIEIVAKAHVLPAAPPFGLEFIGEVPLIETVPGALDASFMHGVIGVGAAYRQGGRTVSYINLPKRCQGGGWPVKLEIGFYGGAKAEASTRMPCARK
jgi:hypothetical protein